MPRRRKQATPKPEENMIDWLTRNDPSKPPPAPTPGKEPTIADLQAQLGAMNKRLEEQDRANLALSAAAPVVRVEPKEPQLLLDGLPDPIVDPKGYATELSKRQVAYFNDLQEYMKAKNAPVQSVAGNVDALWNEFVEKHGAYADDQEGLEFAIGKVMKQAQAKGIDLDKYRFQNSERFFRDVTEKYDSIFGKPGDEEPEPPKRATGRRPEEDAEDLDEGRTAGIIGGVDASGGRAPKMAEENPYAPTGMLKDIQDMQRKSGYF